MDLTSNTTRKREMTRINTELRLETWSSADTWEMDLMYNEVYLREIVSENLELDVLMNYM